MFIETYILRLLAAVKKYGTLSRVGEELGTTQPSISRAMQKLEGELGVTLFERTKNHRLADRKSLKLSDLAGETFVMYDDIGFWDKVKQEKIPDAKFIRIERRNENDSLPQIVGATDMPSFISDRTTNFSLPENRVAVPLTDPEMNVTFYAVCRRDKADDWRVLLEEMGKA